MIDSFVATGSGDKKTVNQGAAKSFALQVEAVGGEDATWSVVLEGSIDGENFTTILTHSSEDPGNKQIVYTGDAFFPNCFQRVRCIELELGSCSSIKATSFGM